MTREQVVGILIDYAKSQGENCRFVERKGCLTARYEINSFNMPLNGHPVRRILMLHDGGKLVYGVEIGLNIPRVKFPSMKKLLAGLAWKNKGCTFAVKKDGDVRISICCDYSDKDTNGGDTIRMLYDLPLLVLQTYAGRLLYVADRPFTLKERFCMAQARKAASSMEENDIEPAYEIRYEYEHRFLPKWFYEDTEEFTGKILEGEKDFLYKTMAALCENAGQEMKYMKEQYKVHQCKTGKGYSMICIEMPEPERKLLCHQVYLAYSNDYRCKKYFTVEKSASAETSFLCSWNPEGERWSHDIHGEGSRKISDNAKTIAGIFRNICLQ